MALYFLETSALVKLYVREPGTDHLLRLASGTENRFAVLRVSQIEIRSAIRRRERSGDMSASVAGMLLDRFQRHLEARFLIQALNDVVLDVASGLIDHHALRAYDAIQLAGYLVLKSGSGGDVPVFVCSDQQLLQAARSLQVPALDPSGP